MSTTAIATAGTITVYAITNSLSVFASLIIIPAFSIYLDAVYSSGITITPAQIPATIETLTELTDAGIRIGGVLRRLANILDYIDETDPSYEGILHNFQVACDAFYRIDDVVTLLENLLSAA